MLFGLARVVQMSLSPRSSRAWNRLGGWLSSTARMYQLTLCPLLRYAGGKPENVAKFRTASTGGDLGEHGSTQRRAGPSLYWQLSTPLVKQIDVVIGGGIGSPFSVINFTRSFS